jgi:hypothetical protein
MLIMFYSRLLVCQASRKPHWEDGRMNEICTPEPQSKRDPYYGYSGSIVKPMVNFQIM